MIRKALPSDAPKMKVCVEASYRHYIDRIGKPPGPMLDDYAKVVQHYQAFVVEDHEEIIGILVIIHKRDDILIDNVAVTPKHQGKGIGRRLIELAESEAVRQGFAHIDLYTNEEMWENRDFYTYLGYIETNRCFEQGYHRVYMRKYLISADPATSADRKERGG